MDNAASPILIGLLYDFPQGDGGAGFEEALQLGLDEVAATGRLDRSIEFVSSRRARPAARQRARGATGLRRARRSRRARDGRPVDLRQRTHRRAVVRRAPGPGDQLLRRRAHASRVDVPLPDRLARGGAAGARGPHGRARASQRRGDRRPVAGRAPLRRGVRSGARAGSASRSPAPRAISPLDRGRVDVVGRLRDGEPDVLVYFGLGVASRAVALASRSLGWDVPVLANSALMFGYARPDWRDGYAGWEYIDTIADDNRVARRAARAVAARRGRTDRLRGLRHGPPRSARRSPRAEHLTRAGVAEGLRRVKQLPATSGPRRHARWASASTITPR